MNDDNGPRNGNDENEWIFAHEADLMAQRPMLLDEVSRLRQHESSLVNPSIAHQLQSRSEPIFVAAISPRDLDMT
jgi:hypothetical protein